jgi:flagellar biosynthesis protein FliQ
VGRYAPTMHNESTLGSLGRRALAWVVLILAALLLLKLVVGVFIGLVAAVMTIVLVVALGLAVVWALHRI